MAFLSNSILDETLDSIKADEVFEGLAYLDHGGRWTFGFGHSNLRPPIVTEGMTITEQDADALLKADLEFVGEKIAKKLTVEIDDLKYGVLCSLAFNGGVSGLLKSELFKMVNNAAQPYHFGYAADMILDYKITSKDRTTGVRRRFLGLRLRRIREAYHFQKGGVE